VRGKSASFDVQIFSTESEWKDLKPTRVLDSYEELNDAVEEAELWREAYQVVVIARGEDNDYEPGECVFDLQEHTRQEGVE
jgi:hypothetical protein